MVTERTFDVIEEGAFSVVRFRADIEEASVRADEILDELTRFVGQVECLKLAIDLSSMTYVPSSMLGILARLHSQGIEVHLVGASAEICEVLEITRLDTILHVNELTLDIAVDATAVEDAAPDCEPVALSAYFVSCPSCSAECQIGKNQLGHRFECSSCEHEFAITAERLASATYVRARCPECNHILRVRGEYLRQPLACNHCERHLEIRAIV